MGFEESRFTPSSYFCPHPEYYHSPDSEATEWEVSEFIGALVRIVQPEYVVETGTYHGHTSLEIAAALHDNGHGHLVTIESNQNEYEQARGYLGTYVDSWVTTIHGNTMDFIPQKPIDLAFFDSWQEGRHEEFLRYHGMGMLPRDAIVAFHDSAPHHQVYKHVYRNLIEPGYIKTIEFHTPRGLLLGQVQK